MGESVGVGAGVAIVRLPLAFLLGIVGEGVASQVMVAVDWRFALDAALVLSFSQGSVTLWPWATYRPNSPGRPSCRASEGEVEIEVASQVAGDHDLHLSSARSLAACAASTRLPFHRQPSEAQLEPLPLILGQLPR